MNDALIGELSKPQTLQDSKKTLELLAQVEELLSTNCMGLIECTPLLQLTATNNAQVKSAIWDLMVRVAAELPEFAPMYVCSLTKDSEDPNPSVRSTAISTLCSLDFPGVHCYAATAIKSGFGDSNPTVRVSAVTGVGKLWIHSPSTVQENGLIDALYNMLRDPDPTVVVFALQTLSFVLEKEGGVVMNRKMIGYFLDRIPSYPEREFCCTIEYLQSANRDVDTVLDILNKLDTYLDSKNGSVVLAIAKLFTSLINDHPSLKSSLIKRLCPALEKFMKNSKRDFQADLLDFILSLDDEFLQGFSSKERCIPLKERDNEALKMKKIRFTSRTANTDNCQEIMNFLLNLLPQSDRLNRTVITSTARVAILDEAVHENFVRNLQLLIKTDRRLYHHHIVETDLRLANLVPKNVDIVKTFVNELLDGLAVENAPLTVLQSALVVIEEFGHMHTNAPYLVEDIFSLDRSGWDVQLYSDVLSAAFSLFHHYPAATQTILSNIFYQCLQIKNHQLHLQIQTYYKLLRKICKS